MEIAYARALGVFVARCSFCNPPLDVIVLASMGMADFVASLDASNDKWDVEHMVPSGHSHGYGEVWSPTIVPSPSYEVDPDMTITKL